MSHISIKRTHHSSLAEATKTADRMAAKLARDYQLRSQWDGNVLHFDRSGLNGTLVVTVNDIQVDVKLGLLMAAFKGPLQAAVERELDALIVPPASGKAAAPATKPAAKAAAKPRAAQSKSR